MAVRILALFLKLGNFSPYVHMSTIDMIESNPGGMRLTSLKRVRMIRFMHAIWHLNLELWAARKLLWQPNMVTSMVLYQ